MLNAVKPSCAGRAATLPNFREQIKASDHVSSSTTTLPASLQQKPAGAVREEVICCWADHEGAEDGDEMLVVCFCGTFCL